MEMQLIVLVLAVMLVIGMLPTWGYSAHWGYMPSGGALVVAVIAIALLFSNRRGSVL